MTHSQTHAIGRFTGRLYYGWPIVLVAAMAMVGTLPGRTQGLGLITEPLLRDLRIDRVTYAELNLWATLAGSLGALGVGRLIDRLGSRIVLTAVAVALGLVVIAMSGATTFAAMASGVLLTRALGQSALSVVSLAMVGQWFVRRIDMAMAVYSVVMSVGFMVAFPVVGSLVQSRGWRTAWFAVGAAILLGLVPIAVLLVRRNPESMGLVPDGTVDVEPQEGSTLSTALRTRAFWVFAVGASLYGLVASGIGLFNEAILAERGLGLPDIQGVIARMGPLEGAPACLAWLRERFQVAILSDTFYEFGNAMMPKLGNPLLLCHRLEIEGNRIVGYRLRQSDPKRQTVRAFRALNYPVVAVGDSFNDVAMLEEANHAFFYRAPANVLERYPQYPCAKDYGELQRWLTDVA